MVAAIGSEKSIVSTDNRDVLNGDVPKEFLVEAYRKHYVEYLNRFGTSPVPVVEAEDAESVEAELLFSADSDIANDDSAAESAELPEFLEDEAVVEGWEVEAPVFDSFPESEELPVGEELPVEEELPAVDHEDEVPVDAESEFVPLDSAESDVADDLAVVDGETFEPGLDFEFDPESEPAAELPADELTVSGDFYYGEEEGEPAEGLSLIAEDDVVFQEQDGGVEINDEDEGVGFYSPEPVPAPAPQIIEREIVREVIVVDREQARDLGYGDAGGSQSALPEAKPTVRSPFDAIRNSAPATPTPAAEDSPVEEDQPATGSYDQPDVEISSAPSKGLFGGMFKKKDKKEKKVDDSSVVPASERSEFKEPSRLRSEGLDSDFSAGVSSDAEENKVISVTTQEDYDPREERRRLQHAGAESRPHVDPASWLEQTMVDALKLDASDLHIVVEGETGNLRARIRVDGQMRDFDYVTGTPARVIMGRLKAATNLSSGGSYAPEEAIYELELDGEKRKARAVLFRVEDGGEALVMRLPLTGSLRQLDELAFSDENLQYVYELLAMPYKLIMLAGPMGSGKTTTAHGALMHIADPTRTVWTIEDPVERRLPNLVQLEIDEENEAGFDVLLSKLLRADYNTLFLGEIRDPDTASAAVRQAKAGRQVMSTIHADDNIKSLMRLIELAGDSPMSVLSAVGGVVSQRLVRKLNPEWDGLDPKTKYKGRVPIHEILFVNDSIVEVMMEGRPLSEIKQEVKQAKGSSFYSDAVRLIGAGVTDREEVVRVIGEFDMEDR